MIDKIEYRGCIYVRVTGRCDNNDRDTIIEKVKFAIREKFCSCPEIVRINIHKDTFEVIAVVHEW